MRRPSRPDPTGAVERRRGPRRPEHRARLVTPVFLLLQFSTLAYFLGVGALLPTLPRYVRGALGGGDVAVGLSVGAFSLAAVLLRPYAGRLGDARGRRALIVGGAVVAAVSQAGYVAFASIPVLVAFRLLTGVGEALFFVGAASAINDLAPEERRGEAVSYFSLALYGGVALGPLFGEALLEWVGFAAVGWAAVGCSVVAAALGTAVQDRRLRPQGSLQLGRLVNPAALLPGFVLFASVWSFSAFSAFIPLYAIDLGLSGSRLLFLLYSGLVLLIRLFGARLPDRLGVRRMAVASLISSIVGLAVMASFRSPVALFAGTPLLAVGASLAFPALMTLAVRRAPPSERGSVVGTFTAFFDLGFGVGAAVLGAVASVAGYRGAFVGAAAVALAGLAVFVRADNRAAQPSS